MISMQNEYASRVVPADPTSSHKEKVRFPVARKIGVGFSLSIGFFIVFQLILIFNVSAIQEQFSFVVRHDAPVISNAERLVKLVVDMETGQRGFIITGEDSFLEPYTNAVSNFEVLLSQEKKLVSDNPSQIAALNKIENLVEDWQVKAAIPEITLGKKIALGQVNAEHIQDLLSEGLGKSILDELRGELEKMKEVFKKTENYKGVYFVTGIEKSIVDRETGQRGFLITGKEEFLEPYVWGAQNIDQYINWLRALIRKTPSLQKLAVDLDRVEALSNKWDKDAGQVEIEVRREMNMHPETLRDVAKLLRAETGKNILDEIRVEFQQFISTEKDLTNRRYADAAEKVKTTIYLACVFIALSSILSSIIAYALVRGVLRPISALVKSSEEIAGGNLDIELKLDTNDEFNTLGLTFDDMRANLKKSREGLENTSRKLARSNEELDNFAYIAAHDLKEPLRAIHNHASFLLEDYEDKLEQDGVKRLYRLISLCIRMDKLTSDLLYYSRLGREEIAIKYTNLNHVIDDVKEMAKDILEENKVLIDMPKELPTVMCDTVRITEMYRNLITNAVKYNDSEEKHIEIGFDNYNGNVFYVKDNGIGIEKEFHKDIFRIFKRLHSEKAYGEGSGSGLTFVKKIIEQHGGEIWLESKQGEGTTFYFKLDGVTT